MVELDPSQLNLTLLILGAFILGFGLFSFVLKEKANVGEAPLAILLGISLGPHGVFNLLQWASSGDTAQADALMLGLSRIVLGIQLTLIGIQLPYRFLRTELVSLLVLIGPVMTMMWLSTTACILLVFKMPLLIALIVSSCTTATDPVLSNGIVKGQFADAYVSVRLRQLISAESGLNDGFAWPFAYLAIHLLREPTTGGALRKWALDTIGWEIIGSILYGTLVGYVALLLLRFATRNGYIDKESFLLYGTGMGVFIVGSAGLVGTDDLLAAFIAGNIFTWDDRYRVDTSDDEVTNVIDLILNQTFFLFVGLMIPFDLFNQPEYGITPGRLAVLSVLVLIFRRLPALLLHYRLIPSVRDSSESAFAGWFGPIGAGACFYASVVLEEFKADDPDPVHQLVRIYVKPLTYALVLASIAGHSLMIPVLKAFLVYYDIGRIKLDDSASDFDEDEDSDTRTISATAGRAGSTATGARGADDEEDEADDAASPIREIRPAASLRHRPISAYSGISSIHSVSGAHHRHAMGGGASTTSLPPRHFEAYDEHTPSSWRMSSGHKLPSAIAHDERTGEEVYYLGARDVPSAWTRAARESYAGTSYGSTSAAGAAMMAGEGGGGGAGAQKRGRSRSRSRSRAGLNGQGDLDGLERGDATAYTDASFSRAASTPTGSEAGGGSAIASTTAAANSSDIRAAPGTSTPNRYTADD
ncbi:hypothetical protein OC834_003641 [Tilletia horrida]|nr:hypothetical protein OC834_003641 [Tilletia horrida]